MCICHQGKRKCDCKENYIGDGIECEVKQLSVNRCLQDNGQCQSDAQCTDLHYEGMFFLYALLPWLKISKYFGYYKMCWRYLKAFCAMKFISWLK